MDLLFNALAPVSNIVFKNIVAKPVQVAVKCPAVVCLSKFTDKPLQVRITCDHEGSYRYSEFPASRCLVERFIHNFPVESETVFIIFNAGFQTGWFSVGNHKNLFVRSFPPPQYINGQFQSGHRICMIGTDIQIGEVFNFNRPRVVSEYDDVESIFWIFSLVLIPIEPLLLSLRVLSCPLRKGSSNEKYQSLKRSK